MSDYLREYDRRKLLGDFAGRPSTLGGWLGRQAADAEREHDRRLSTYVPGGGGSYEAWTVGRTLVLLAWRAAWSCWGSGSALSLVLVAGLRRRRG